MFTKLKRLCINHMMQEIKNLVRRIAARNPEARAMLQHEVEKGDAFIDAYNRLMKQAGEKERARAQEKTGGEKALEGTKQDVEKLSLRELPDGTKYVEVDTVQEIFEGISKQELPRFVERYITDKFRGKVIGTENRAYVDRRGAKEYAHPAKRNVLAEVYEAKAHAATELGNIMDASTFIQHNEDDGRHLDAVGGWDEYRTLFRVDGQMYQGQVSIMLMNEEGTRRRFHDLTKIRAVDGYMQGRNAPLDPFGSNNSITEISDYFNPSEKFSLRDVDQDMEEMQRVLSENETLQKLVGSLNREIKAMRGTQQADSKAVRSIARELKAMYESKVSTSDLAANLQAAFDQMANANTDTEGKAAMARGVALYFYKSISSWQ